MFLTFEDLLVVTKIFKSNRFTLLQPFPWSLEQSGLCPGYGQGKLSLISGEARPIKGRGDRS